MKYLIVAGGEVRDYSFFKKVLADYSPDRIIAADSGALHLQKAGLAPDILVGDFDSIEDEVFDAFEKKSRIVRYRIEKDVTDTAAALDIALEEGADDVLVLGGTGTRFDHTYANVLLLKKALDCKVRARIVDEHSEIELHDRSFFLENMNGRTVSFYSMFKQTCLTLEGFHYPLTNYRLESHDPLTVSNIVESEKASVEMDGGYLLSIISKD